MLYLFGCRFGFIAVLVVCCLGCLFCLLFVLVKACLVFVLRLCCSRLWFSGCLFAFFGLLVLFFCCDYLQFVNSVDLFVYFVIVVYLFILFS